MILPRTSDGRRGGYRSAVLESRPVAYHRLRDGSDELGAHPCIRYGGVVFDGVGGPGSGLTSSAFNGLDGYVWVPWARTTALRAETPAYWFRWSGGSNACGGATWQEEQRRQAGEDAQGDAAAVERLDAAQAALDAKVAEASAARLAADAAKKENEAADAVPQPEPFTPAFDPEALLRKLGDGSPRLEDQRVKVETIVRGTFNAVGAAQALGGRLDREEKQVNLLDQLNTLVQRVERHARELARGPVFSK